MDRSGGDAKPGRNMSNVRLRHMQHVGEWANLSDRPVSGAVGLVPFFFPHIFFSLIGIMVVGVWSFGAKGERECVGGSVGCSNVIFLLARF
ncbi:hypothetical protein K458DRAFT_81421 [Lentithecium fluviatile CBS 122367]|uniref:Uncharacterized protein n=1 Tax=Lentithecium fluviatile CBS 122367 TaxID=1168545 RepID=A0A6G1ITD9_9PLEO|nr:hypothetical protein K458DRAFT_81421 [Lentithecium fluviatile CBS 122367]